MTVENSIIAEPTINSTTYQLIPANYWDHFLARWVVNRMVACCGQLMIKFAPETLATENLLKTIKT